MLFSVKYNLNMKSFAWISLSIFLLCTASVTRKHQSISLVCGKSPAVHSFDVLVHPWREKWGPDSGRWEGGHEDPQSALCRVCPMDAPQGDLAGHV